MPRPANNFLREFFETNSEGNLLCNQGKCNGKMLNNHAGNLERHLKTVHCELYDIYINKKNNVCSGVKKDKIKIAKEISKSNVEKAIVELFTTDGRPFRMAEDRAFRILTEPVLEAAEVVLNEHNITERIVAYSNNIKDGIRSELKKRLISLKIDAATRQHLSVLAINVQYIKNKTIIIQTLAIKELKEKHTAEYLKSIIFDVLLDYQIDLNQILTVTTDNGANMVNDLNADLKYTMEEDNVANCTEYNLASIEQTFNSSMISNIRCGAHTLQLCVNDVLKIEKIKEELEKFRKVAKKLRNPTYLNLLKDGGYNKPIIDCITRWNSTYNMIQRLSELKKIITTLSLDSAHFFINEEDWSFVEHFLNTFASINSATVKLQSEKLYYSDFYVIIMDIIFQVENVPSNDIQVSLLEALNKRKEQLFDSYLFNAAVFLDPRLKIVLQPDQIAKAKAFIRNLHVRIASLKEIIPNTNRPTRSNQECQAHKTLDDYLCSLDPIQTNDDPMTSLNLRLETDLLMFEKQMRLPLNTNLMEFWSTQGNSLTCLAEIILAIPCTQVSVERLFSAFKYILSDVRNKLTFAPFALERILLVRANGVFEYD